jgi:hypothetical protein
LGRNERDQMRSDRTDHRPARRDRLLANFLMTSPSAGQADEPTAPLRHSSGELSESRAPNPVPGNEPDALPRLLFLDDDPARAEAFLMDNPQAVWVQTVAECIDRLAESWDEIHLDHDLGGQTYVDSAESDCGMEVIRWLCQEPREHLRNVRFFIHTHNMIAGMLMVIQMRQSGYVAEFRPFGQDPLLLLRHDEDEESPAAERPPDAVVPAGLQPPAGVFERVVRLLTRLWRPRSV